MEDDAERVREKFELKPKPFEMVNAPLSQEPSEPIQVEKILRDNLKIGNEAKPFVLDLEKKTSRRKRDYILLMVGGNAVILLLFSFLPHDPLVRLFGWSAVGLFSLAVTWVMWGVMDNY